LDHKTCAENITPTEMTVVYSGNYSMGGAFGSEYLNVGTKRLHRSDNVIW